MTYVLAWIIVGVCCYFLERNKRYAAIGKYGLVEALTAHDKEMNKDEGYLKTLNALVETLFIAVSVALAPVSLFYAFKSLFKSYDYKAAMEKLKEALKDAEDNKK